MSEQLPTFIMPEDIAAMDHVAVFKIVEQLRARRMATRRQFEELEAAKKQKNHEWIQEKLDKLYLRMSKQYISVDNALEKLETIANQISAMRLQKDDNNADA